MMKYWKNLSLFFLVLVAIVILVGPIQTVWAQPPGDPCPGGPPCDPEVPISGIEILLALGGLLGIRKLLTSKKDSR
jgi:hypothetical protein